MVEVEEEEEVVSEVGSEVGVDSIHTESWDSINVAYLGDCLTS